MMVRRRRLALLAVPLLAFAAACSGGDDSSSAVASGQELKIGLLAPLKGPDQAVGKEASQGAQLAADVINGLNPSIPLPLAAEAGLPHVGGAKVGIVTADSNAATQDEAQVVAGNAVNRLVSTQGADALVGAFDSQVTQYASQRSERYEVPFVNADSPATFLTDAGRDWFFRIGPSWQSAGQGFFSLLRERDATPGKVVVVHLQDSAGQDVVSTVQKLAQQTGIPAGQVKTEPVPATGTDFAGLVARVAAQKPDVVFVYLDQSSLGSLLQAVQAAAFKPKAMISFALGELNPTTLAQTPTATDGLLRSVSWSTEAAARNPAAQAVTALYQRRFNADMTEAAASAFTAVMTVAQAADSAGALDNTRIRSALLNLDVPGEQTIMPWAGVQFDETHQNVLAQSLVEQLSDRQFHVVYPSDVASRKLLYPAPAA